MFHAVLVYPCTNILFLFCFFCLSTPGAQISATDIIGIVGTINIIINNCKREVSIPVPALKLFIIILNEVKINYIYWILIYILLESIIMILVDMILKQSL